MVVLLLLINCTTATAPRHPLRWRQLQAVAIYPDQKNLRETAIAVAEAVMGEVQRQRGGQLESPETIQERVRAAMWYPEYPGYF